MNVLRIGAGIGLMVLGVVLLTAGPRLFRRYFFGSHLNRLRWLSLGALLMLLGAWLLAEGLRG